ncbi:MAG TPA: CRTAC1 family protein, partial [Candidatus Dormibacteraeota bacterium]|nr:CRTAC1 family protein [Candidatus Dormibacteraeota bacterium]
FSSRRAGRILRVCGWLAGCSTWLLFGAGCGRTPNPTPEPTSSATATGTAAQPQGESLEQIENRFDATVWKNEVLAQLYERTMVTLSDNLRRATNKVSVLAEVDFDEIVFPKPQGPPALLPLGITHQHFDQKLTARMPRAAWEQTLKQLYGSGWRVAQAEWYHEKFVPPRDGREAWSEWSFEIHGERLAARTRFIMKGTLAIDWDAPSAGRPSPRLRRLTVTDLSVLEREGPPGFNAHAVVTPNPPEHPGEMVNMHPVVVTDIDGDGDEDIVMTGVNQLFLNDGTAKFTPMDFISESVFRGSKDAGVVADFDGDGKLDFLTVAKQGSLTNRLVIYPGNGRVPFAREPVVATEACRIDAPSVITAGDIDQDGDLDIWVGQYKPPYKGGQVPTPYYDANDGYPSYLLLNDGHGHFEPATATRGLISKRFRRTLAASFVDLDGDNDLDLVTINDYAGVDLYYNDGTGRFTDETARLYNPHLFGMGHCFADFDRDGVLDFLAIGMSVPTVRRLEFMKLGRADFEERTRKRVDMGYGNRAYVLRDGKWVQPRFGDQLARTGWSWGTTAFDIDNNGAVDVFVANGHISGESCEDYDSHIWTHDIYVGTSQEDPRLLAYFDKPFRGINTGKTSSNGYQHDVLFTDVGTNDYVNTAFLMGLAHEEDCRAVISADLNNDGRMDLVLTEGQWFGGPHTGRNRLHVHLNQLNTGHHWIGVKLTSNSPGIPTIGAKVWAKTDDRTFVAQIVTGDSYESQHPSTVHFGLGRTQAVKQLIVRWPNGKTQTIENPAVDRYHPVQP